MVTIFFFNDETVRKRMKGKYDKPFVQLPGSIWYIESSVAGEKEMR